MTYQRQHRGSLSSRISLSIATIFCFYAALTTGNDIVVLNKPSGVFQSPGYPHLDNDVHIIWKVIAPLHHEIILTFLDFDLVDLSICRDKVKIYEVNVLKGKYRGRQLYQQSVTSTSNTISIVLMSCPTSIYFHRRGIQVLFSTVYPTTFAYSASTVTPTKLTSRTEAMSSEGTSTETFYTNVKSTLPNVFASTPAVLPSIEYTSSGNSTEQGSLYAIIGAVLTVLLVLMIIAVLLIHKRRGIRSPTSDHTTHAGNSEKNQENAYFTTVATDLTSVKSLGHDYEEVNETRKVILDITSLMKYQRI